MGLLLWSRDSPRSLKETAEGRDPKSPVTLHSVEAETVSVTPKEKQAREVQRACISQHPQLACHEVHTLGKRRSERSGNWEVRGLVVGLSLWLVGCREAWAFHSLSPSYRSPSEGTGPTPGMGPTVFSLELGRVPSLSLPLPFTEKGV